MTPEQRLLQFETRRHFFSRFFLRRGGRRDDRVVRAVARQRDAFRQLQLAGVHRTAGLER